MSRATSASRSGSRSTKMDRTADPRQGLHALRGRPLARCGEDPRRQPADLRLPGDAEDRPGPAAVHPGGGRAARAPRPPKGSPRQQVGDFYASGMDEERLTELGVAPLNAEFDRIAAIDGPDGVGRGARPPPDDDLGRRRWSAWWSAPIRRIARGTTIYVGDGDLALGTDNYLQRGRPAHPRRLPRRMVTDDLVMAGQPAGGRAGHRGEGPRDRDADRAQEAHGRRKARSRASAS